MWDEIPYPFPVRQLKFWNEKVISFHTLLGMWVLVHAEISVDLCSLKWRVFNTSVTRFRSKWSGSLFIGDDRCLRHITEPCSVVSVANNSAVEDYTIQLNVIIVVIWFMGVPLWRVACLHVEYGLGSTQYAFNLYFFVFKKQSPNFADASRYASFSLI